MSITNTQDLLFLVLAIAIALITVFLIWALYYVVMMLRHGYAAIRDIEKKLASFDEMIRSIKEHLVNSSSSLAMLAGVASKLINFFRERRSSGGRKTKSRSESE